MLMLNEDRKKNRGIWYYEDMLYMCWAWDKELINRGDIACSVGKNLCVCRKKIEELKNNGLFDVYKQRFESGDYIGGLR